MPEVYTGPKFSCTLDKRVLQLSGKGLEAANALIQVCKKFLGLGLAPEYEHSSGKGTGGNYSFRCEGGFIITGSPKHAASITVDELVLVRGADLEKNMVEAIGIKPPSSECLMHYAIYSAVPQANAVIHWHDDGLLAKAGETGIAETEELEAGTPLVAKAVAAEVAAMGLPAVVAMKGHGLLSAGKTIGEAAGAALRFY